MMSHTTEPRSRERSTAVACPNTSSCRASAWGRRDATPCSKAGPCSQYSARTLSRMSAEEGTTGQGGANTLILRNGTRGTATLPPTVEPPPTGSSHPTMGCTAPPHILPPSDNHTQVRVTPSYGFPPVAWPLLPLDLATSPPLTCSAPASVPCCTAPPPGRFCPALPLLWLELLCPSSQDLLPLLLQMPPSHRGLI